MKHSVRAGLHVGALLFLFLLMQVVCSAAGLLLANADKLAAGQAPDPFALVHNPKWAGIALFFGELLLILLLWVLRLIRRQPIPRPRLALPRGWLWAALALLCFSAALSLGLSPLELDDAGMTAMFDGMKRDPICLLALILVGPLTEEFVFREGIQRELRQAGWSAGASIGAAAVLFGVVHANFAQGIPAAALGLVLGLLYERTGDIRLSGTAHVINNALAVGLMYFPEIDGFIENFAPAVPILCGMAAAVLGGVLLYRWEKGATPPQRLS